MTQRLSLFAEPATDEPTEDTARAPWDKRLGNFENWLRSLNKAKRTIRGYTTDTCAGAGIGQLLDFLEGEGRLEDRIDTDDLIDFPSTGSGRRLAEQQKQGARSRPLPSDAKTDLEAWLRPEVPPEHDEGLDEGLDQAEGDRVFPIKPRAVRLVVKKLALSLPKGTQPSPAFARRSAHPSCATPSPCWPWCAGRTTRP